MVGTAIINFVAIGHLHLLAIMGAGRSSPLYLQIPRDMACLGGLDNVVPANIKFTCYKNRWEIKRLPRAHFEFKCQGRGCAFWDSPLQIA